jgi:hypothetical protein
MNKNLVGGFLHLKNRHLPAIQLGDVAHVKFIPKVVPVMP